MAYVKIIDGVVVQKQPNKADGFIEVQDDIICGMIQKGKLFVAPAPREKDPEEVLKEIMSSTESIGVVARKLEEIIDNIENGTALSKITKDWAANRKTLRG